MQMGIVCPDVWGIANNRNSRNYQTQIRRPKMEKHIYKAINKIQASLSKSGISKERKNQQQGYAFRGIDDVYETLAPLLAENGVVILPHYTERSCTERTTAKGGVCFYAVVKGTYEFVDSLDCSTTTCELYGEAMDTADKATNKAMSAAYKYMCLQTFCIPTKGDNDADATTHVVTPKSAQKKQTVNDLVGDEIPFTSTPVHSDDWMSVNAFAGEMERCNDVAEISKILNGQKGNPKMQELIPLASARKKQILDNLQMEA